jgi:hypothetical protein
MLRLTPLAEASSSNVLIGLGCQLTEITGWPEPRAFADVRSGMIHEADITSVAATAYAAAFGA